MTDITNRDRKTWATTLVLLLAAGLLALPVSARDDDELGEANAKTRKPLVSNEALEMGAKTARSLQTEGERLLANDQIDKAIKVFQRAIDIDADDIDVRVAYAKALEAKLSQQSDKDPYIFSKCVEQWLVVMRNQVGEEKGMGVRGISLFNFDSGFADEERQHLAREHLKKIVGFAPKPWETNAKYLKRAMTRANVNGKLVKGEN